MSACFLQKVALKVATTVNLNIVYVMLHMLYPSLVALIMESVEWQQILLVTAATAYFTHTYQLSPVTTTL